MTVPKLTAATDIKIKVNNECSVGPRRRQQAIAIFVYRIRLLVCKFDQ
jgi:hypothetical protein